LLQKLDRTKGKKVVAVEMGGIEHGCLCQDGKGINSQEEMKILGKITFLVLYLIFL
jgi:hypothetical protein